MQTDGGATDSVWGVPEAICGARVQAGLVSTGTSPQQCKSNILVRDRCIRFIAFNYFTMMQTVYWYLLNPFKINYCAT